MERGDIDPDAEQGLMMVLWRSGGGYPDEHTGAGLVPECKENAGKKMSSRIQKGKNGSFLVRIQI